MDNIQNNDRSATRVVGLDRRESNSSDESATRWVERLRNGDASAAETLWQRHYHGMVETARRKLKGVCRAVADEEDVASCAFHSFWVGVNEGKFTELQDQGKVQSLLTAITAYKSVDLIRRENRQKRGGTGGPEIPSSHNRIEEFDPIGQAEYRQQTPDHQVQEAEQADLLMEKLYQSKDTDLSEIALAKIQGESNSAIAEQLGCSRRTIERKLRAIYRCCTNEC